LKNNPNQLIFLGPPGSGKGTQAQKIIKKFGYKHVSTGDLLRLEIGKNSLLGNKVKGIMDRGELVGDDVVLELLKANCDLSKEAYIFDGFPRNDEQAMLLDKEIIKGNPSLAILFKIDLDELKVRLINRRSCLGCGLIYNLVSAPPKQVGKCNKCGTELSHRSDDSEEAVTKRLSIYRETITSIIKFYEGKGNLKEVDASRSSEEVFKILTGYLG
jgi:adenylate kinase